MSSKNRYKQNIHDVNKAKKCKFNSKLLLTSLKAQSISKKSQINLSFFSIFYAHCPRKYLYDKIKST